MDGISEELHAFQWSRPCGSPPVTMLESRSFSPSSHVLPRCIPAPTRIARAGAHHNDQPTLSQCRKAVLRSVGREACLYRDLGGGTASDPSGGPPKGARVAPPGAVWAVGALGGIRKPSPDRLPTGRKGQRIKDTCAKPSFRKPLEVPLVARPASDTCPRRHGWCPLSPASRYLCQRRSPVETIAHSPSRSATACVGMRSWFMTNLAVAAATLLEVRPSASSARPVPP